MRGMCSPHSLLIAHCSLLTHSHPPLPLPQSGATCTDGLTSFTCTCPAGVVGTLLRDGCADDPCMVRPSSLLCSLIAVARLPSHSAPPSQHGTCTDTLTAYTCSCQPGWEGAECDIEINECDSGPCLVHFSLPTHSFSSLFTYSLCSLSRTVPPVTTRSLRTRVPARQAGPAQHVRATSMSVRAILARFPYALLPPHSSPSLLPTPHSPHTFPLEWCYLRQFPRLQHLYVLVRMGGSDMPQRSRRMLQLTLCGLPICLFPSTLLLLCCLLTHPPLSSHSLFSLPAWLLSRRPRVLHLHMSRWLRGRTLRNRDRRM